MFGPNTTCEFLAVSKCHRDKAFLKIFRNCQELFKKVFNLEGYDILFIPGSATVGVEALMYSLKSKVKVVGPEGTFKKRWEEMAREYNYRPGTFQQFGCRLETSTSIFAGFGDDVIVDAISSFPFVSISENCPAFVTCSNKLLGSFPGLAIVGVKKDKWGLFRDANQMSYLNLARYKEFSDKAQTPSTAPTHLFEHLEGVLENLDVERLRRKINTNSDTIVECLGKENFKGSTRGPVLTLSKHLIPPHLAEKYELYGINNPDSDNYQIFTYSEKAEDYLRFAQDLYQNG